MQVVFRCGDPLLETELEKVGVSRAQSVIALTREDMDPDDADSSMLRQVLSIKGALAKSQHSAPRVTVELQDVDNKIKIELANPIAEVIVTHDVIGQIMVSCSRQPGLAFVLEHIMAFEGSEFYFEEWPELRGKTFRELLCAFDGAVVVGLKVAEGSELLRDQDPGLTLQQKRVDRVKLTPPDDYVLQEGDQVIVLAEDNDSYEPNDLMYRERLSERGQQLREQIRASHLKEERPSGKREQLREIASTTLRRSSATIRRYASEMRSKASMTGIADDAWNSATESMGSAPTKSKKEKILFIGWRRDMADMIRSLDVLVQPGSELWLFASVPVPERVEKLRDAGNKRELVLENLVIRNALGNPTIRRDLLQIVSLDEFGDDTGVSATLLDFDSTLILADQAADVGGDNLSSDGRTLATFLLTSDVRRELLQAKKGRISRREQRLQTANLSSQMRRELAQQMKEEISDIGKERIISEILDAANTKSLLSQLDCTGYVLSSRLVSNYIAQVAENTDLNAIFSEILEHKGNEFFLRFAQDYLDLEQEPELSFWDVLLRVRDQGEVLIGYKPAEEPFAPFDSGAIHGWVMMESISSLMFDQGPSECWQRANVRALAQLHGPNSDSDPLARPLCICLSACGMGSANGGMMNLCNPEDKRTPRRWRRDDVLIVIAPIARERSRYPDLIKMWILTCLHASVEMCVRIEVQIQLQILA